ncbi:MAG: hypothetical protein LBR28_02030 [Bacteroidales bacterium]|nr:hypothetical protein [Bacteroidales bacterium]
MRTKTLVAKFKTLVAEFKTLVASLKTLVAKFKTLVAKFKTLVADVVIFVNNPLRMIELMEIRVFDMNEQKSISLSHFQIAFIYFANA